MAVPVDDVRDKFDSSALKRAHRQQLRVVRPPLSMR